MAETKFIYELELENTATKEKQIVKFKDVNVRETINSMHPEILWEIGSSPTGQEEGDVSLTVEDYREFTVIEVFGQSNISNETQISARIHFDGRNMDKSTTIRLQFGGDTSTNVRIFFRDITFNPEKPNQVHFGVGKRITQGASVAENQNYMLPTKIIGYKYPIIF